MISRKTLTLIISLIIIASSSNAAKNNSIPSIKNGFAWGLDVGSSIDLGRNGLSSVDADAYLGYKNEIFRIIGVGSSIHNSLNDNNSFIPVYFIFRTNFSSTPTLCFLDLRGGCSFNSIGSNTQQRGVYGSIGIGFNLYCSSKLRSHLILSYNYFQLQEAQRDVLLINPKDLQTVSVKIGICF